MGGKVPGPQADDIADLVERAQSEVKTFRPPPPEGRDDSRLRAAVAGVAAAGALVAAYVFAAPWFLGFSDSALRQGLTSLAEAARKEVEAYRRVNGSLPDNMPNPMLALAVDYRRAGEGYRIVASDGSRTVEMDASGAVDAR